MIRASEGAAEEDLDIIHNGKGESEGNAAIGGNGVGRVEYDMDEQDEQWLDAINSQRKTEQVDTIKPYIFEIVMTKIEKEWHALEKEFQNRTRNHPKPIAHGQVLQLLSMGSHPLQEKSKTVNAPSATMATVRTPMLLSSVMVAILQFIKNVTVSPSFQKASGFAENVN